MAAIEFRSNAPKTQNSIAALFGAVIAWNDRRSTRNSLNKLSERELDDIGLIRGDIDTIASGDLIR